VARFYTDENIPLQTVAELRRLSHDVLTSLDAGRANASVPDSEVLAFAAAEHRILLSHNRRDFLRLHRHRTADHAGIVLCTFDPDFSRQAQRIHDTVTAAPEMLNQLFRVNRPGSWSVIGLATSQGGGGRAVTWAKCAFCGQVD
jgi:hypothetical protein